MVVVFLLVQRSRYLKRFYSANEMGSGIGLALVKSLLEGMQGTIECHSHYECDELLGQYNGRCF